MLSLARKLLDAPLKVPLLSRTGKSTPIASFLDVEGTILSASIKYQSSVGDILLQGQYAKVAYWRDFLKSVTTHANFLAANVAGIGVSDTPRQTSYNRTIKRVLSSMKESQ
jgi:hypothetical protein